MITGHRTDPAGNRPRFPPAGAAATRSALERLPRSWRWWGAGAIGLLLLGVAAWRVYDRIGRPPVSVPEPSALDQLEPQLRAYVAQKVAWVRQSPRDAQRHATLGMVYAANGLWGEARLAFLNVTQLQPKEPLAHLYVAVATHELGRDAEVVPLLRQLTTRFPDFAPGHYRLGDALLRAGAVEEAAIHFQRLIELAPGEWRGYAGLGDVKLRRGDAAGAAQLLERAVRLDREAKTAHHLLGQAYQRLGREADAQRELRRGLKALHYPMPDAWSASAAQHMRLIQDQLDMANEYTQAGHPERAIVILETARPFHTNNLALLNNLGVAYNQLGQPDRARPLLEGVLQLDARNLAARVALSVSYLRLGRTNEALAQVDQALVIAPNNPHPRLAKANLLLALERDQDALAELEIAARLDPQNAQLRMDIGDIYLLNLNRPETALVRYQQASQLDPSLAAVFVRLADVYLRQGNPAAARAAWESLRALAPNDQAVSVLNARLQKAEKP